MIIKSNTPLSDNELMRVKKIMQLYGCPEDTLKMAFPSVRISLVGDTLFVGNPPWDLSQEIQL